MKIGPVLTDFIQQAKVAAYLLQCLAFFWYPNVRKYSPSSLYQDALTIPARPSSQRIGTVLKLMCNFKTFDKVWKAGSLERCGYLTVWSIHKKTDKHKACSFLREQASWRLKNSRTTTNWGIFKENLSINCCPAIWCTFHMQSGVKRMLLVCQKSSSSSHATANRSLKNPEMFPKDLQTKVLPRPACKPFQIHGNKFKSHPLRSACQASHVGIAHGVLVFCICKDKLNCFLAFFVN